jgi:hypothetical protein
VIGQSLLSGVIGSEDIERIAITAVQMAQRKNAAPHILLGVADVDPESRSGIGCQLHQPISAAGKAA